jgi:hypothetical protein
MKKCSTVVVMIFLMMFFSHSVYALNDERGESITSTSEVLMKGYIKVFGSFQGDQEQYRAIRAAKIIAYKKALITLREMILSGDMTVNQAMRQSNTFKRAVSSYLRDAMSSCGENFDENLSYTHVCIKLWIRGREGDFYTVIHPLLENEKILLPFGSAYEPENDGSEKDKKTKISPEYDSLIIDARAMGFQPAFINRIITSTNQFVYNISDIMRVKLAERGMGGYAHDENSAREILKQWGASHPLIIKPQGAVNRTDIKVSEKQGETIFNNNKKSRFLENAKVVFIF